MTRTVPGHVDSTGKLLERIALLAKEPVTQRGRVVRTPPTSIMVTPSILREFTCIAGCTACCLPFTLDFTPDEFDTYWYEWPGDVAASAEEVFYTRAIEVNGNEFPVRTYDQFRDESCPFLRPQREGGALGCGFFPDQPLECAAAPQILMTTRGEGTTALMKRPFGRGWAWKDRPQCEFEPTIDHISKIPDTYDLSNEISLLERYAHWAGYFEVETWIPEVIEVLEDFPTYLRDSGLRSVVIECH